MMSDYPPKHQKLPPAYLAASLFPGAMGPLRTSLLLCKKNGSFEPIQLYAHQFCRVYLAVLVDDANYVHDYFQLYLEDSSQVSSCFDNRFTDLDNHLLDRQWSLFADSLLKQENAAQNLVQCGLEYTAPSPLVINLESGDSTYLNGPNGQPYKLIKDDIGLQQAGLPTFSSSLTRFACCADEMNPDFIIQLAQEKDEDFAIPNLTDVYDSRDENQFLFNETCGRFLLVKHSGENLKKYWGLLLEMTIGDAQPDLDLSGTTLQGVFSSISTSVSRYTELFYLKLSLIRDMISSVAAESAVTSKPLLNLTANSFAVNMQKGGRALPESWSAIASLSLPGSALCCKLQGSEETIFLNADKNSDPIYKPAEVGSSQRGEAVVRLQDIINDNAGEMQFNGSIELNCSDIGEKDLVWLRIMHSGMRFDLFCHLEPASSNSNLRTFRTITRSFDSSQREWLTRHLGVPLDNTAWERVANYNYSYDLYSLAVLAIQTLLVNENQSLGRVMEQFFEFCRVVDGKMHSYDNLTELMESAFSADENLWKNLGPHNLSNEDLSEFSKNLFPPTLWYDALAIIMKALPGYSFSISPAVSVQVNLNSYSQLLLELDGLIDLTRSLILGNWNMNCEIHQVINKFK